MHIILRGNVITHVYIFNTEIPKTIVDNNMIDLEKKK